MRKSILPGVMSALLTPFNEDGSVKLSSIGELVDFQLERGLDGLYVCGSTGEGMVMESEDRMAVAEAVVKAARGRKQVIVHVGCPDTKTAVKLARHADSIGADGLSSVPPYYYKHDKSFVAEYYRDLAGSTELPILAYYVPSLVAGLSFNDLLDLMKIRNVVGIKFTEDNFELMYKLIEQTQGNKIIFTGHDALLLSGLVMNSSGGIGAFYNVMPKGFSNVYKLFKSGDLVSAKEEMLRINHFINIMKKYMLSSNQAPLKAVLKAFGVDAGVPKKPAKGLGKDDADSLVNELKREGFFSYYG